MPNGRGRTGRWAHTTVRATTVWRALVTMAGTFAVGLVVGAMADKMAKESAALKLAKKEKSSEEKAASDR